jgi:hypothetical protein
LILPRSLRGAEQVPARALSPRRLVRRNRIPPPDQVPGACFFRQYALNTPPERWQSGRSHRTRNSTTAISVHPASSQNTPIYQHFLSAGALSVRFRPPPVLPSSVAIWVATDAIGSRARRAEQRNSPPSIKALLPRSPWALLMARHRSSASSHTRPRGHGGSRRPETTGGTRTAPRFSSHRVGGCSCSPDPGGWYAMRNLGRTAYARFRAEQAAERACRYIRNEGREVVLRGDLTQVDKMIASIRLISPPANREGLIADVRRQVSRVQAGFKQDLRIEPTWLPPSTPRTGSVWCWLNHRAIEILDGDPLRREHGALVGSPIGKDGRALLVQPRGHAARV